MSARELSTERAGLSGERVELLPRLIELPHDGMNRRGLIQLLGGLTSRLDKIGKVSLGEVEGGALFSDIANEGLRFRGERYGGSQVRAKLVGINDFLSRAPAEHECNCDGDRKPEHLREDAADARSCCKEQTRRFQAELNAGACP